MNAQTVGEVERIIQGCEGKGRDSLIPVLQEIQDVCGYLPKEIIFKLSRQLRIPSSKIYGVATFYNQFRFDAPGRFEIQVCRGTACHVKGSAKVLDAICRELKIKPGQTTRDGMFNVVVVACIGACSLSPVITVDGEFHAGVGVEDIKTILDSYREKAESDEAK